METIKIDNKGLVNMEDIKKHFSFIDLGEGYKKQEVRVSLEIPILNESIYSYPIKYVTITGTITTNYYFAGESLICSENIERENMNRELASTIARFDNYNNSTEFIFILDKECEELLYNFYGVHRIFSIPIEPSCSTQIPTVVQVYACKKEDQDIFMECLDLYNSYRSGSLGSVGVSLRLKQLLHLAKIFLKKDYYIGELFIRKFFSHLSYLEKDSYLTIMLEKDPKSLEERGIK